MDRYAFMLALIVVTAAGAALGALARVFIGG